MLSDPQSVTIAGTAVSLPKVQNGPGRVGVFENADGTLTFTVSHTNSKRARSTARFDRKKVAPDVMNPSINRQSSASIIVTVDSPLIGFSDTELADDLKALLNWTLVAGNLTKFLGGES